MFLETREFRNHCAQEKNEPSLGGRRFKMGHNRTGQPQTNRNPTKQPCPCKIAAVGEINDGGGGGSTDTGQHNCIAVRWAFFLVRALPHFIATTLAKAPAKAGSLLRAVVFVVFVACTAFCPAVCQDSATPTSGVLCFDRRSRKGRGPFVAVRRRCRAPRFFALVVFALVLSGGVDSGRAVFAPVDSAALKAAVGTCSYGSGSYPSYPCTGGCLGETRDGSCPNFAASNDATGNPYGVMGDWDVSLVTSLENSTSSSFRSSVPNVFHRIFLSHPFIFSSFLLPLFIFRLGPPRH
jgi:hypothetical protein